MIVLIFHRQRANLTEHLQIKFHHSSLILIGGIECVTIAPRSTLLVKELFIITDYFSQDR